MSAIFSAPDRLRRCALVALALWGVATTASAQQRIELHGRGNAENDAFLRDILKRTDLVVIRNDTLIARDDTLRGTILVLVPTTSARIDGTVVGDLVVVDGNLFLRPTARVQGRVYNIGGGFYPSELAVVSGGIRTEPNAPYEVEARDDGVLLIRGTSRSSALVLDGIYGVSPPTYDRVNGFAPRFGASLMLPPLGLVEPSIRGRVIYNSERSAFGGGGELAFTRRRTEAAFGYERVSVTNEEWIRSDLHNSIGFFATGNDYRDYYTADIGYFELRRILEDHSRRTSEAYLRGQVEKAKSLLAGDPWTIAGTPRPENMVVDSGTISSAIAGLRLEWTHPSHVFDLDAALEIAAETPTLEDGFTAFYVDADWAMPAFSDHVLEFEMYFQGPLLGTGSLPLQRWSFVGGSGTLYTFVTAEFRGDRVAFLDTKYSIPLPNRFRLPIVGAPSVDLMHFVGMAWSEDIARRFRQNVGLRLRFNFLYVRAVTDPEDFGNKIEVSLGATMPRRAWPWQTAR